MNYPGAPNVELRSRLLLLALPCLNFVLLAFLVFHYALDAPFWDQWDFVPLLNRAWQHNLRFQDFWMQHNEHRLVFPRLVMLACARLSGWNVRWEMGASLLCALTLFGVYVHQIRSTAEEIEDATIMNLIPVVGLAVFSLRQHQNWEWGWQLQIFMNVLAVVVGITTLARSPLTWNRLVRAIACGIVATFSFANGMLYWVVGGFVLLTLPPDKARRTYLLAWITVSAATVCTYFYQYVKPGGTPSLLFSLLHPVLFVKYACCYLGSLLILKQSEGLAAILGLAGLILFAWAVRQLLRSRWTPRRVLTPYFALALYALLSAVVSGIGRAGLGGWQALESRYTTISELFWIATITLLFLALRQNQSDALAKRDRDRAKWMLVFFGSAFALGSLKEAHKFKDHYVNLLPAQEALRQGRPASVTDQYPDSRRLYPESRRVDEGAQVLKRYHLNLYQNP